MDTKTQAQWEALNNSIEFFGLTGYSVRLIPETDGRIKNSKFVFCEPSESGTPNGITGRLPYEKINEFIRGYGMAFNHCQHEQETRAAADEQKES
jgi:hypothetical protein